MTHILACLDGSLHANSVCALSAWAAEQMDCSVTLLHVVPAHADRAGHEDLSGQIGLGAKSDLLDDLVKLDTERAKLEQKKGQLILAHGIAAFDALGAPLPQTAHRRGAVVDTVAEMEKDACLLVIGKRGETATKAGHLGSNLERVTHAVTKPLLIATKDAGPVSRFLIAYDGSPNSKKALDFACTSNLFRGLDCHLLTIGAETAQARTRLNAAIDQLKNAGLQVTATLENARSIDAAVTRYITDHKINMLVMGTHGHSAIRRMIFGSTTMAQVERSSIPVLLFR